MTPTSPPLTARLDGAVAVVTGAGSGIGRGIAEAFATAGASVVSWERDPATTDVPVDVRDGDAVDAALADALARHGRVDVLVNNAGGVFASPLLDTTDGGFDALYRANLRHVLLCTRRVAKAMVESGRGGSIVNVTSIEGVRGAPGYAAYAAAKAGVINLTKTAALELAPHGIRVNAVAPDVCLTEGLAALAPPGSEARWSQVVPLGRAGTVEEVAAVALFLASPMASYVTGQTVHVDGGTSSAAGWYRHPGSGEYVLGPSS